MKIIAHRGNNIDKVENNIEGILETLSYDFIDGIEIDVRMTKDGVLVLEHNLLAYSSHKGIENIAFTKYKDLKKQTFVKKGKHYKIQTLHSFFQKVHTSKIILIECKEEYGRYQKFVRSLLKEIKHKKKMNLVICSFAYPLLTLFQQYCSIPTGLLVGYFLNLHKDYTPFSYLLLSSSTPPTFQKPYYVWTVQNKKELASITKNDYFVGIITDKGYIFDK